jgi:hypothetical protein
MLLGSNVAKYRLVNVAASEATRHVAAGCCQYDDAIRRRLMMSAQHVRVAARMVLSVFPPTYQTTLFSCSHAEHGRYTSKNTEEDLQFVQISLTSTDLIGCMFKAVTTCETRRNVNIARRTQ